MSALLELLQLNLLAAAALAGIYAVLWLLRRKVGPRTAVPEAGSQPSPPAPGGFGRRYRRHHDRIGRLYQSFIAYYILVMAVQTDLFTDGRPRSIFVLIFCVPTLLLWIYTVALWRERGSHDLYPAVVLVVAHVLFGVSLLRQDLRPLLHILGWST